MKSGSLSIIDMDVEANLYVGNGWTISGCLEDHPRTCKWLVTPIYKHLGHLGGEQPYLGDLLTMVINHLLNGMILQVVRTNSQPIVHLLVI